MQSPREKFAAAVQLFEAKKFEEAEHLGRQVAASVPTLAPVFTLLGFIAHRKKDHEGAVRFLKQALSLGETNLDSSIVLVDVYQAQSMPKEAWEVLKKLLPTHGHNPKILTLAAKLSADFGWHEEAVNFHRTLFSTVRGDPESLSRFGLLLLGLGHLDEARTVLDRALEMRPDHEGALAYSIRTLAAMGELDNALQRAERALSVQPQIRLVQDAAREIKLQKDLASRSYDLTARSVDPRREAEYVRCVSEGIAGVGDADLNVVFFHVGQAGKHVIDRFHERETDYIKLLSMSATQAKKVAERVNIFVLTDHDTQFPGLSDADAVVRLPAKREWITYERMLAQRAFAAAGGLTANTLFIDTDVFLNRNFEPVFKQEFDVGLTWRTEWPYMPINAGIVMARKGRTEQITRFFDGCLATYEEMIPLESVRACFGHDLREFWGDQLSLAAFVHWRTPPVWPDITKINDVAIRFFSCEEFNRTYVPALDAKVLEKTFALHFKGPAKKYAQQFVNSQRV